jgi:ferrochelatase
LAKKTGIILINIGSAEEPTEEAVRRFLAEFLSDPYVIDYPRWLWMPILKGIILKKRPAKSAQLYKSIWSEEGSPLVHITQAIGEKLNSEMPEHQVVVGMRYGEPSIKKAIIRLVDSGVEELIILPLFPQYSSTTTETGIEKCLDVIEAEVGILLTRIIDDYHQHPAYINALAESISNEWNLNGRAEHLLFSYHSIPQRYIVKRDEPYQEQCQISAELTAKRLGLGVDQFTVSYQSRFGAEKWLEPKTNDVFESLGARGLGSLHVVCSGFAADCLETLEEIAVQGRKLYQDAGGKGFHYLPALNDSEVHIKALAAIIKTRIEN